MYSKKIVVGKLERSLVVSQFLLWLANFHDIMTNREANEDFAEFVRNKIHARVKDPVVAEKLVPKDHPFGSKRIPLETNYYETYNRDNVLLVDVRETPTERISFEVWFRSDCPEPRNTLRSYSLTAAQTPHSLWRQPPRIFPIGGRTTRVHEEGTFLAGMLALMNQESACSKSELAIVSLTCSVQILSASGIASMRL